MPGGCSGRGHVHSGRLGWQSHLWPSCRRLPGWAEPRAGLEGADPGEWPSLERGPLFCQAHKQASRVGKAWLCTQRPDPATGRVERPRRAKVSLWLRAGWPLSLFSLHNQLAGAVCERDLTLVEESGQPSFQPFPWLACCILSGSAWLPIIG